jgi:hypothetical protein
MATPEEQQFFDWFNTLSPDEQSNFQATFGTGNGPATTTAPTTPAAVPGVTAPAATPVDDGAAVATRNRQVFNNMALILQQSGLGDLFTIDANGVPGGWLWDQITSGIDDEAALQIAFEQTPQFIQRFPAITAMRKASAGGLPGYVPTPADVREYESKVAATMRQAGLPTWFYDEPGELQSLMIANVSALEVEERLGRSWEMVRNTDPLVLNAFSEFFGVQGDGALAAFFLDPTRTTAALDRAARTAYTSGMGSSIGLTINKGLADRIAGLPSTEGGIWQDLQTVGRLTASGGVFDENIGEVTNLTAEAEGIGAVMLGDGEANAQIQRRIIERKAIETSSQGGAALTEAGLTGVASA